MSAAAGVLPRLHIVTDDIVLAGEPFVARATALLEGGGRRVALHLRGHGTAAGTLFRHATLLRDVARRSGALLVINDRVDVALAAGLRGVQLGRRSLPVGAVRRLLPGAVIGASVHDDAELAAAAGTDLVLAGTIYESASHAGMPAAGPDFVRTAAAGGHRVIAIGGVTADRVAELAAAGAHGVAALGGIWHCEDPLRALTTYMTALAAAYGTNDDDD